MMNKKIIVIIPIVVIIIIILAGFSSDSPDGERKDTNIIFHATLADPKLYVDGTYTDSFTAKQGEYNFRFVPNGSSPKVIAITLKGDTFDFSEDFKLVGTLQKTEISEYFTWRYDGQNSIMIPEMQEIAIIIDPNGEMQGSVSVDILER